MSRYIDADALKKQWTIASPEPFSTDAAEVIDSIDNAPTVDAVAVVRCKDCVYWREAVTNGKGFLICPASGMEITESDFCSNGEREEKR